MYLKNTIPYHLRFVGYLVILKGYSDANLISDSSNIKFTSSYVFRLDCSAIFWKSAKQTILAEVQLEQLDTQKG